MEKEQIEKRRARTKYELQSIETGDILKVTYYESMTSKTEASFQGIVIGKFGKGIMESVELRNMVDGVEAEMRIPLLSPLIKDIVRPHIPRYYFRNVGNCFRVHTASTVSKMFVACGAEIVGSQDQANSREDLLSAGSFSTRKYL